MAEGGTSESESIKRKLEAEKDEISGYMKRELKRGDIWYLIDCKWFKQWKKYVGYDQWDTSSRGEPAAFPGPVDNSPLLKEGSQDLKEHLIDELDYILLPKDGWEKIKENYGITEGQTPIQRKVIEQGMFVKHCKVEVYLVDVKLCENFNATETVTMTFSRCDTIEEVEKVMRQKLEIPDDKEVRLWHKYMSSTYEPLNRPEQTLQEAGLYSGLIVIIEQKNEDGTWPRQNKSKSEPETSHTRSFNSYSSDYESGRSGTVAPGLCGLANLGNTCFMNSAIQCMSNVPKLTNYLLGDRWKGEVNEDNPLGMGGEIARSYAELIKTMWSGRYSYTVPRSFKIQVGKFAPQFSGYQQQDSQELLAFLLDGLHEDLNRIKKKPYIEIKDSDSRPDHEVAAESWNNYKMRNDSVIVDTFHGLLKSTVNCPECPKISVTFDPFCYLSLPMPIKKERLLEVFWVPLSPEKKPMQMKVLVPKMGSIGCLCTAVGAMLSADPNKMVVTDVYNHRFHKIFSSGEQISNILDRDDIFIYEVPVVPAESTDIIIVPIYMREQRWANKCSSNYQMSSWQLFGQPMLLALPSRMCTSEILYKAFLQRIARYVQVPSKEEVWWKNSEEDDQETEDCDTDNSNDNVNGKSETENQENGDVLDMETSCSSTDSNSKCINNSSTDSQDCESATTNNKEPKSPQPKRLVKFTMVNSYGSAEMDYKIKEDGAPLKLTNRSYIAADWHPEAKEKFYLEKTAEEFEQHESMKVRAQKKQLIQLDSCLELFTRTEELGENDLWYCPECKKHQPATKKFDLWSLPEILIVHLKRFSYSRFYRDKIDAMVEFPTRGFNLKKYIINPHHGPVTYDLIAVSNHYGGLGGGHYTAYGMNKDDGEWYYFDDSSVTSSSEDDVVSKAAYVLVYQKQVQQQPSSANSYIPENDPPAENEAMET